MAKAARLGIGPGVRRLDHVFDDEARAAKSAQ
jgi:hypothetical protein